MSDFDFPTGYASIVIYNFEGGAYINGMYSGDFQLALQGLIEKYGQPRNARRSAWNSLDACGHADCESSPLLAYECRRQAAGYRPSSGMFKAEE